MGVPHSHKHSIAVCSLQPRAGPSGTRWEEGDVAGRKISSSRGAVDASIQPTFKMSANHSQQQRVAYAHTLLDFPVIHWERIERHLEEVGGLAERFAASFKAEDWGAILGRWHDLGKYSADFQSYLLSTGDPDAGAAECRSGRVDHSTFGRDMRQE
jgi:hypothetical protein